MCNMRKFITILTINSLLLTGCASVGSIASEDYIRDIEQNKLEEQKSHDDGVTVIHVNPSNTELQDDTVLGASAVSPKKTEEKKTETEKEIENIIEGTDTESAKPSEETKETEEQSTSEAEKQVAETKKEDDTPTTVSVIDVTGMYYDSAKNILESTGFKVKKAEGEEKANSVGRVSRMEDQNGIMVLSGTDLPYGSEITLVVNKKSKNNGVKIIDTNMLGSDNYFHNDTITSDSYSKNDNYSGNNQNTAKEEAVTPMLDGLNTEAAVRVILSAGLKVGTVTSEYSDTVEKGMIIEQSPKAYSKISTGDKVNFSISKGCNYYGGQLNILEPSSHKPNTPARVTIKDKVTGEKIQSDIADTFPFVMNITTAKSPNVIVTIDYYSVKQVEVEEKHHKTHIEEQEVPCKTEYETTLQKINP